MKWIASIVLLLAVTGSGADTASKWRQSLSTPEGMEIYFGISIDLVKLPPTINKERAKITEEKDHPMTMTVSVDAQSAKDCESVVCVAAMMIGEEKRLGALFERAEVDFITPTGTGVFYVPLVEAQGMDDDAGNPSRPGIDRFVNAADFRDIDRLSRREVDFPGVKSNDGELNRVVDAYLFQKGKGFNVATIKISRP